jgi:AcrR family transcriptional regulator
MTDKRSAILDATLNLISQRGFHGTPMSMIAEEAGVGAGTIYRYFDSKEALINELYLELKHEISQAMLAGVTLEASTEEIFRKVWLNTFYYCI